MSQEADDMRKMARHALNRIKADIGDANLFSAVKSLIMMDEGFQLGDVHVSVITLRNKPPALKVSISTRHGLQLPAGFIIDCDGTITNFDDLYYVRGMEVLDTYLGEDLPSTEVEYLTIGEANLLFDEFRTTWAVFARMGKMSGGIVRDYIRDNPHNIRADEPYVEGEA